MIARRPTKKTGTRKREAKKAATRKRDDKKLPPNATVIKLLQEAYGSDARTSALADFVEMVVLTGLTVRESELRDRLKDTGVSVPADKYVPFSDLDLPGDYDDSDSDYDLGDFDRYADSARAVFALFSERHAVLGSKYPFDVESGKLVRRDHKPEHDAYLTLLAMTIAHAYAVPTGHDPRRVFEASVANALRARGWRTANLGVIARDTGNFKRAVTELCTQIELSANLTSDVLVSRFAKDEGIDTVAHQPWGDTRVGRWILIGQATIAKSDEWERKLSEPWPGLWGQLLSEYVEPLPFLAVPHHVQSSYLRRLVQGTKKVILDRLRLTMSRDKITDEERQIASAVMACQVEYR